MRKMGLERAEKVKNADFKPFPNKQKYKVIKKVIKEVIKIQITLERRTFG